MPARSRPRALSTWTAATATLAAAVSLSLIGVAPATATAAGAAPAGSSPLGGSVPNWATPQAVRGATPAGTGVSVEVYLTSRDPGGLAAYASEVSDPTSSLYRHYLTPAAQDARFGPTAGQQSAVKAWLAGAGMRVTADTEQYISATGSPATVRAAFGTPLDDYAVSGHTYYAPQHSAVVPNAVAPDVLGVAGLDDAPRVESSTAVPVVAPGTGKLTTGPNGVPYIGVEPCTTYYDQSAPTDLPSAYGHQAPSPMCGYLPKQLQDAYRTGASGLTGKGVTVAVVDAYGSPTIASDVVEFDAANHFPTFKPGQFSQVVTPSAWQNQSACGDWTPEESLDVEEVHTMAPGAKVVYVGANSCFDSDLIAAEADIVDNHLADVVSDSFAEDIYDTNGNTPASTEQEYTQEFEQGATEGIGFNFSSGDCSTQAPAIVAGGVNCDAYSSEPQTMFPAEDPWVTAVGASAIGIGKHGNYEFETGMGDSQADLLNGTTWSGLPGTFTFGSGGGTSSDFAQPYYQKGVVPPALADTLLNGEPAAAPMREVPDVGMEGDLLLTTMVGFTQKLPDGTTGFAEQGYGGTSVACPLFSGVQADAQQAAGRPLGFANPEIYARYRALGTRGFHTVTDDPGGRTRAVAYDNGLTNGVQQGWLFTLGTDYTLKATPGYNDVTGLGSPELGYLLSFRH